MVIRKAVGGEEARVLAFYYDLIDGMRDMEYRPSWTKGVYPAMADIRAAVAGSELSIALEGERIAGAFILNRVQGQGYGRVRWRTDAPVERVGVLHLLAVHPDFQGRGVAKTLLSEAVALGRARGDAVIRLDTLTWNRPGRRLYEGFGFRYCGDYAETYPTTGTIPFSMYELECSQTR